MLFKFLVFSFVFYLIIRFLSRFFVFSTGSQSGTGPARNQNNGQHYKNRQNHAPNKQSVNKELDQVEEAEFEDITEKSEKKSNS